MTAIVFWEADGFGRRDGAPFATAMNPHCRRCWLSLNSQEFSGDPNHNLSSCELSYEALTIAGYATRPGVILIVAGGSSSSVSISSAVSAASSPASDDGTAGP